MISRGKYRTEYQDWWKNERPAIPLLFLLIPSLFLSAIFLIAAQQTPPKGYTTHLCLVLIYFVTYTSTILWPVTQTGAQAVITGGSLAILSLPLPLTLERQMTQSLNCGERERVKLQYWGFGASMYTVISLILALSVFIEHKNCGL